MDSARISALALAFSVTLPSHAWSFLGSYGREHPAECAAMRDFSDDARAACATREWCAMHEERERSTVFACDMMRSRADTRKPRVMLNAANLGANIADGALLPAGMKFAKLALKADISYHLKSTIIVRLGIASPDAAFLAVSWKGEGAGPGAIHTTALSAQEIDHLMTALNASDFWRLPQLPMHYPLHMGYVDGETARVTIATAARRHTVEDAIGDSDAVDASILVNALSQIIQTHWPEAPTGR